MYKLELSVNIDLPSSSGFIALKALTEALSSSTVSHLGISEWQLTSRHAYHLLLLITQARYLKWLNMSNNLLQECVPLLVSAANSLEKLAVHLSGIGDRELLEIGLILQSNTNLKQLSISSRTFFGPAMDSIKPETVSRFIEMIIAPHSRSQLCSLMLADCYKETLKCDRIQTGLRRFASQRGYPLDVTSPSDTSSGIYALRITRLQDSLPSTLLTGNSEIN